ncbi:MAG: sigma-70 family RNA polymerase sigma factor [Clostridia bacterium]|nr:sigma-70 family RNA polymerase sigma factor [Clostridia bacterium]
MTLKELSQLYYLKKEIKRYEQKIEELRTKAEGTTQALSGMPGGGGNKDKVGTAATAIVSYENKINAAKQKCEVELKKLEDYIDSISDSRTRQIFMLRFVEGKSWNEAVDEVGGSEDSVKKICYRYIKKNKNCPKCPERMC